MIELLKNIDTDVLIWINHSLKSEWMDDVMIFCSGRLTWLPLYAVLLILLYKSAPRQIWLNLFLIVCCITLADQTASAFFKPLVERLRPCHDPDVYPKLLLVKDICGGKFGFVSSHAANTFAVALFFYKKKVFQKKVFMNALWLWAAIVALSRVYLGVHFPGDILCGAIVGIFSTLLVCYIQQGIENRIKAGSTSN
jgi:undecaprenyl-diphosphatase